MRWSLLLLLCATLLPGCSGSRQASPGASSSPTAVTPIGRWNSSDENRWIELTAKGTVAVVSKEQALVGTYLAKGSDIEPVFVALNSSKRSHSAGIWKMRLNGDRLTVTNPDHHDDEYQRSQPLPELKDAPVLGRWEWMRKGSQKLNSLEFTPWGSFISVRWLRPKGGGGSKSRPKGELEELREAGTYRLEGNVIYLTTYRRRKSNRKLQFQVVSGVDHDKLVITHTRPDGTAATAEYKRSL
ncbi:MAG: hypothetical protein U0931_15845 [Vulcanimicrobiota bacterium]